MRGVVGVGWCEAEMMGAFWIERDASVSIEELS